MPLLEDRISRLRAARTVWQEDLEERRKVGTVISDTPFVVICPDGLGLHVRTGGGVIVAVPTVLEPGLPGISRFSRKDAEHLAAMRGRPYRAVAAAAVPSQRIAEIDALIMLESAARRREVEQWPNG